MSTAAGGQGSSWTAWPARKIPFAFDSGYPYVNDVLNAMNTIQNASRVWFCERGNEANYVLIQNLAGSSFSDVGMRNKGQQLANIQAGYKALHELGHTLGFIHEQDRTDRDTYITIDWANLVDPNSATGSCLAATAVNGNAQFAEDPTCVLLTSYDPHSVMHYPAPATGWQGCPSDQQVWTMRWKADPNMQLGGGPNWTTLTQNDIIGINKLYDGISGWSYPSPIAGPVSAHTPGLAAFQNGLYIVWDYSDQIFWSSSSDGSHWKSQQVVPNVGTSGGPALSVFQGKLYMAWMGVSDNNMWTSSFDGTNWTAQQKVADGHYGTTNPPVICTFQNRLYMAWKGSNDDHIWWAMTADGTNWSSQQQVQNVGTSGGPTLAVFDNQLYLAWKGSSDQHIWWSSSDGSTWNPQQQVPNAGTTDSPALCPHGGKLYLAWKGSGDNGLWYADFDGSANPWSGQAMIAKYFTSYGPALSEFNNNLFMAWLDHTSPMYGEFTG